MSKEEDHIKGGLRIMNSDSEYSEQDEVRSINQNFYSYNYGKYKVFLQFKNEFLIGIGPNWLKSLVYFFFSFCYNIFIIVKMYNLCYYQISYTFLLFFTIQCLLFWYCFLKNPGISFKCRSKCKKEKDRIHQR